MTAREIRVATVFGLGMGVALVASPALIAQAPQKAAAQIIQADQEDEFVKGTVSIKAPGLTVPKPTRQSNPKYTPNTLREKIQGDVRLEAVVGFDGRIEKIRVKESLHPELDVQAVKALEDWQFEPGRIDLQLVRVLVEIQMSFRTHSGKVPAQ